MSPKRAGEPELGPSYAFYRQLIDLGYQTVVGVDEVGRGALAGPVVVAAVEVRQFVDGVNDSKAIARAQRELLAQLLRSNCAQIKFGIASNQEIDQLGMGEALRLAYRRSLASITAELVLTDHYSLDAPHKYIRATKGEALFYPVAAASIMAKTYRDQLMRAYSRFYPQYSWEKNAGYATATHRQSIKDYGSSTLHRESFLSRIIN
jgi:ribonuclease HII